MLAELVDAVVGVDTHRDTLSGARTRPFDDPAVGPGDPATARATADRHTAAVLDACGVPKPGIAVLRATSTWRAPRAPTPTTSATGHGQPDVDPHLRRRPSRQAARGRKRGTDRSVIFDSISASFPISVDITTT